MKIAGITWWRNNYGSVLQAYALQTEINKNNKNIEYEILCQFGKKANTIKNLKDKLKKIGLRKTIKRVFWKFGLKRIRDRNVKIQRFINEYLKISEKEYNEESIKEANNKYDGFICGSDQIWNPKLVPTDSIYWLTFAEKDKIKIAYAPSVGVEGFDKKECEEIRNNLTTFKAISTREQTSTELINKTIGENKCVTVLDPTLLVERDVWDNLLTEFKYKEPYIFTYMLRGTKKQRKLIEKFAEQKGLKIITMPFLDNEKISLYDLKFGDIKYWDASPIDFINLIKNAEYIFTDSFHCMLFSCMYHKTFFVFPKIGKAQVNRLESFQKMINTTRMINDNNSVKEIEHLKEINWNEVDTIIKEKRKESRKYLQDALKKNEY